MAIYHLASKHVTRSTGRSAVAAAAYRAGDTLTNEREGRTFDFSNRKGVAHAEIVLPTGSGATWALDRSALWNAAEAAENRKDARTAREFEIALPHELSAEQRLALVRAFAQDLADKYGTAVDFAIHEPDSGGDNRNHHAHVLMTTRILGPDRLAAKSMFEQQNLAMQRAGLPTQAEQLVQVRKAFADLTNAHLATAGLDARVDHRSYKDAGIALEATVHTGVEATAMGRRGESTEKAEINKSIKGANLAEIEADPDKLLAVVTARQAVFTRQDIAKALHQFTDDPVKFQAILVRAEQSKSLVQLSPAMVDTDGRTVEAARYSTLQMIALERGIQSVAGQMQDCRSHRVAVHIVQSVITENAALSDEQARAVRHVLDSRRIAAVVGDAGTGKSFSMKVAREAWEAQGYRVLGAALAGIAAAGLEQSAGIKSATLDSLEHRWRRAEQGRGPKEDLLTAKSVLVIDEAGMLDAVKLARVLGRASAAGAKVVLLGDDKQLGPIGAGAPFKAIVAQVGAAEITQIRRQSQDWARQASAELARGSVRDALVAYEHKGKVILADSRKAARDALVADYVGAAGSKVILAHSNADVRVLNQAVRTRLQEAGEIDRHGLEVATEAGVREFAPGDRVVFLKNDRRLQVQNGSTGTVERTGFAGTLAVRLDAGRQVEVDTKAYNYLDHGYALTVHKAQGQTVGQAFVLATPTMDRSLAYVAMTRHRDDARLYAGRDDFLNFGMLASSLSRVRSNSTTLDYELPEFAERRGFDGGRVVAWAKEHIGAAYQVLSAARDQVAGSYDKVAARLGLAPVASSDAAPKPIKDADMTGPRNETKAPVIWLAVPYSRRAEARAAGARFDPDNAQWYAPRGKESALVETYGAAQSLAGMTLEERRAALRAQRGVAVAGPSEKLSLRERLAAKAEAKARKADEPQATLKSRLAASTAAKQQSKSEEGQSLKDRIAARRKQKIEANVTTASRSNDSPQLRSRDDFTAD